MAAAAIFEQRSFLGIPLPSRVDEARVLGLLEKGELPHMELIYFPYYAVAYAVRKKQTTGVMHVLVEAWSSAFLVVNWQGELTEGEPLGPVFPPRLDEEEAVRSGREYLVSAILRQRGSRRDRPVPEEAVSVQLVHLPLWVYYYARKREFLDIRVMSALDGELLGQRSKVGVLDAFAAMRVGPD